MRDPGSIPQQFDPPTPREKSPWPWIGLGLGVLSVIAVAAVAAVVLLAPTDDDRGGTFAVGDRFEVENVYYTITSVETGVPDVGGDLFRFPPDQNPAFVVVHVRIENERWSEVPVDASEFALHTGNMTAAPWTETDHVALLDPEDGAVEAGGSRDFSFAYDAPDLELKHVYVVPGHEADLMVTVDLTQGLEP